MARLQVEIDGNAKGLTTSLGQANSSLDKFSRETAKVSSQTQGFTKSVGNANGVAMEFNRIIQDAPFGMMGIGNNLQQLTANWATYSAGARAAAVQTGQTVTTMTLLRGVMTTMLSPAMLLSVGVAAITSAWTFYTMWSQRAKKATDDNADAFKRAVPSINNFASALRSIQDSRANEVRESLTKGLNDYEQAQTKATVSARLEVAELKRLYTASQDTSRGLDERTGLVRKLKKEYPEYLDKFTVEQILAGKASEAYDKLTVSIQNTAKARVMTGFLEDSLKKQIENERAISKLQQENAKDQAAINERREKALQSGVKYNEAYTESLIKQRNAQIGILEAQNKASNTDNNKAEKEINALLGDRLDITKLLYKEDQKELKEKEKLKDVISGIIGLQGNAYADEIYKIQSSYEELVNSINKSKGTKDQISEALGIAKAQRDIDLLKVSFDNLFDNINGVKGASKGITITAKDINVIPSVSSNVPSISPLINSAAGRKASRLPVFSDKDDEKLQNRISKLVEGGFRRGISGILDNIDDLGSNFYEVFNNVFSSLAGSINKIFTDVIATQLGDKFKDLFTGDDFKLTDKIKGDTAKAIVAGAGIAGGLISSMSSKSSAVGQGLGGALSGAAAGMAFGPWGAAIGGVVGAISGIFGAKAARKQEKLQEEALKEQRKQTALMEYQNAKGWESNIIGQMTSQGIVNGFSRDATGQLIGKFSGHDFLIWLERERKVR